MNTPSASQVPAIEFRTTPIERSVLGALLIFLGGGVLAFWDIERSTYWPLLMIMLIGILFVGIGFFLVGFRRTVRLECKHGVNELRTLFGVTITERHHPLANFDTVGSRISSSDAISYDVMLFGRGGRHFTLCVWLKDTEAQREITRVAQCLGLHAEREPRARTYLIGP